jgi:hypothetical protein
MAEDGRGPVFFMPLSGMRGRSRSKPIVPSCRGRVTQCFARGVSYPPCGLVGWEGMNESSTRGPGQEGALGWGFVRMPS